MFVLFCGLFLMAAVFKPGEPNSIGLSIPSGCLVKSLFGFDCPGCGITRSVSRALHLHFHEAFLYHPVGPLVAASLVLLFGYFLLTVVFGEKFGLLWEQEVAWFERIDAVLVMTLIGIWIRKLL